MVTLLKMILSHLLALLCIATQAADYRPEPHPAGGTGIRFKLPYTLGTHEGVARKLEGTFTMAGSDLASVRGKLVVPVSTLDTDHAERDCHLREAMGLDYTKSEYPERHLCDENDKLAVPLSYPEIQFEIVAVRLGQEEGRADVDGKWTMHGVTHPIRIPVVITRENEFFRIKGKFDLSLKAHGIEVKSAKVLLFTISVEDKVSVELDFRFAPVP